MARRRLLAAKNRRAIMAAKNRITDRVELRSLNQQLAEGLTLFLKRNHHRVQEDRSSRSRTLRVNYRTSNQIRTQADRLLGPVMTDVDGNSDDRSDTVSIFNGQYPFRTTLLTQYHHSTAWIGVASADQFNLARPPLFREERFKPAYFLCGIGVTPTCSSAVYGAP